MPKANPATPKPFVQPTLCDLEDIGPNLHTALRKCCDSATTTKLYLLICLRTGEGVWPDYCTWIHNRLTLEREVWVRTNPTAKWTVWSELLNLSRKYEPEMARERDRKRWEKLSGPWLNLFTILLGEMDNDEWHGFASYLTNDKD